MICVCVHTRPDQSVSANVSHHSTSSGKTRIFFDPRLSVKGAVLTAGGPCVDGVAIICYVACLCKS